MAALFISSGSSVSERGKIMNKYRNRKTVLDGIEFDSAKEARRYAELLLLQKAGEIYDLQRQVPFVLIPKQTDPITGRLLEREAKYIADFTYRSCKTGRITVEDTKGLKTREYVLKRKMMLYRHGIRIQEV